MVWEMISGTSFGLYLEIAYLLRVNDDDGTPLAKAVAAGPPDVHIVAQALFFDLFLKAAATSLLPEALHADPEQRVMQGLFGSLFERMSFPEFFQFSG